MFDPAIVRSERELVNISAALVEVLTKKQ